MNVLIACEYSGKVRDAFRRRGHNAWSCDLLPTDPTSPYAAFHYQGDVRTILSMNWDLVIAHPECTYHTNSGVRWFTTIPKVKNPKVKYGTERWLAHAEALEFFQLFQNLKHVPMVAIENPVPHKYTREVVGDYTQIIHPWEYGHEEMKSTCLWLKGLPALVPTDIVGPPPKDEIERRKWQRVHFLPPSDDRWQLRSTTFDGIADAMGAQWGIRNHSWIQK